MNTVTTGPESNMFIHVSGGCGIRDGMLATLKAEIQERQDIVNVLEAENFEKFKAIHAKKRAAAMEQSINAQAEALYGDRPTHGDAIAEVRKRGRRIKLDAKDGFIRKTPKKGKRFRRDAAGLAAEGKKLLAYVTKHPGQRGEQIAAALGTDVGTMRKPMKALIAAKKVKTKGVRRGMCYFVRGGK